MAHERAKPRRRNRIPRRTFLKLLAAGTLAGVKPLQVTAPSTALAASPSDPGPLERAGVSVNPNPPGVTPKRGGMIVAGQPGDIVDFSPFQTGATRFPWHHNIYTPLFYYDSNLNVVPALAENYGFSNDKLTLTVKLRPGQRCQGTALQNH